MSTNSKKSNLSKSSVSEDDDQTSEATSFKEENCYTNDTFEEDVRDQESVHSLSLSTLERLRDANRQQLFHNKTFTSSQIREIERQNAILMNKILTFSQKPCRPKINQLPNKYHLTSAAINRKKNQMKIDWENQILLKKIQTAKPSIKRK